MNNDLDFMPADDDRAPETRGDPWDAALRSLGITHETGPETRTMSAMELLARSGVSQAREGRDLFERLLDSLEQDVHLNLKVLEGDDGTEAEQCAMNLLDVCYRLTAKRQLFGLVRTEMREQASRGATKRRKRRAREVPPAPESGVRATKRAIRRAS